MLQLSIYCLLTPNHTSCPLYKNGSESLFLGSWHDVEPYQQGVMEKHWKKGFCFLVLVSSLSMCSSSKGNLFSTRLQKCGSFSSIGPGYTCSFPGTQILTSLAPNSCCSYGFPRTQLLQFFAARSTQHFWHSSQMICSGIFPMKHCPMISFFWNQRTDFQQVSTSAAQQQLFCHAMSCGYAFL